MLGWIRCRIVAKVVAVVGCSLGHLAAAVFCLLVHRIFSADLSGLEKPTSCSVQLLRRLRGLPSAGLGRQYYDFLFLAGSGCLRAPAAVA